MKTFFKIFVINFFIGILYSIAYHLCLNYFKMEFLTTALLINTIGSLQGCLWYYLGVLKERKEEKESFESTTRFNILTDRKRGK